MSGKHGREWGEGHAEAVTCFGRWLLLLLFVVSKKMPADFLVEKPGVGQ